jgi:hypothetical protein
VGFYNRPSLSGFEDSLQHRRLSKNRSTKKKSWRGRSPSQLSGFGTLRQLSADSSGDDGGGGNSGVRWTSSMTAQNSSCSTDTVGNSQNNRCMDSSRIGTLDSQIRPRLLRRQP